ncbi:hypothetical protein RHMOL_Rhmol09G0253200 [Rhododendron molle]|uniref:Uncharacterized protein n=1 Tax=Rhododendron molle TaxID=49168 RepID=A0ACC0MHS6_RHOML|nr:hypothetical protein RHMOL_Rhmol09G0253200 [Rhododendron molle]
MGWCRRPKAAFDLLHYTASKLKPRNPTQNSPPRINHPSPPPPLPPTSNNPLVPSFSLSSSISRNSCFNFSLKQNQYNPFLFSTRRCYSYYVTRLEAPRYRPKRKWYKNPRTVIAVVLFTSGVVITVYFGNLETVPYTKRKHFVLLPKNMERQIGEAQFQQIKQAFKGKILPTIHPESVRVKLVAKDIIEAVYRGLKREHAWRDFGYATAEGGGLVARDDTSGLGTLVAMSEDVEGKWRGEDDYVDENWVEKGRKRGKGKGREADTGHLEGLKWEVLVVDEPVVNAFCLPGGKIVVFTGLLEHFRTDPEIATVLGHEVGHAVARHAAEQITKNLWLVILQLILFQFLTPDLVYAMSTVLLRLPFSRRMEMEADCIGLLLMASAGYDPRVAPKVYEKLGQLTGDSPLRDYLSTHPSGKKRAQHLAQAQVMQEALALYREAIAGQWVRGFLHE